MTVVPPPEPPATADEAEFMASLRRLKTWSGRSYRQLERAASAAGEWLPSSTAASMLTRQTLPREELLWAYVRACGLAEEPAEAWLAARTRTALGDDACVRTLPRRLRVSVAAAAALAALALGGTMAFQAEEHDVRVTTSR
ncbi:hypothetical protein G5C51_05990 [Streptomyces sp. A7024]|uniref:XRE family transcriptional regulator n=1 Tax=Streptomyces coryli TaxID=1128680 RepID=A0A6G4TUA5_9ACTN|nr:hypothetical protein [Streptomyces coryli]NGN63454.1 hypothetical protein [Streptomyces coryli]